MKVSDIPAWWTRLPAIFGYPLHLRGILAAIFLGFAMTLARWSGIGPTGVVLLFACLGLVFSTLFLIVRDSADGSTAFPEVNISDLWDDLLAPGLAAFFLTVALYGPAVFLFLDSTKTVEPPEDPAAAMSSFHVPGPGEGNTIPTFGVPPAHPAHPAHPPPLPKVEVSKTMIGAAIAWLVMAILIHPLAFMVLAIGRSLKMALFPVVWFTILGQVFLPYAGLLIGLALIGGIGAVAELPFRFVSFVPILPSIGAQMVSMYFAMCSAHLLGWFVYQYHERLGYKPVPRVDTAATLHVGGMGQQMPASVRGGAGVRVGAAAAAGAANLPQMYEGPPPADPVPADEGEIAGLAARFAAACGARDLASASASAPLLLDARWGQGDIAGAAQVYAQMVALDKDFAFDPARQLRLAKELEAVDPMTAATAWRCLAFRHPQHPQAARALFRCGECYSKAGRADWAARAWEVLLQRYPMSDEAGPARAKLKAAAPAQQKR